MAAQHQVDARPEFAIDHLGVAGKPGVPARRVAAPEVVDLARRAILPRHRDPRVAADETQRKAAAMRRGVRRGRGGHAVDARATRARRRVAHVGRSVRRFRECKHDLAARQEERVARALRVVDHPRVGLALVLDEGQRQLRVGVQNLLTSGCGWRRLRRGVHRGAADPDAARRKDAQQCQRAQRPHRMARGGSGCHQSSPSGCHSALQLGSASSH